MATKDVINSILEKLTSKFGPYFKFEELKFPENDPMDATLEEVDRVLRRLNFKLDYVGCHSGDTVDTRTTRTKSMNDFFSGKQLNKNSKVNNVLPLCIPNNFKWDKATNQLQRLDGARERLVICNEGLNILRSIKGPICLVCVVGAARTGKSYLLGKLQGGAFRLGHSMKAETMGIWIGTTPLSIKLDDGREAKVVFIDSEGIGAADSGESSDKTDNQIFTLSVLCSSLIIYNTKNVPCSSDLEKLHYIAKLSQSINLRANGESKDLNNLFKQFAPEFFWLLRDVSLKMTDKNDKPCDTRTYMTDKVLALEKGLSQSTQVKNGIRLTIQEFFSKFDAFSLPLPSDNPTILQNLEDPKMQEYVSPSFLERMDILKNKLYKKFLPKHGLNGNVLNGPQLADMMEIYLKALNSNDGIPNWQSAWESTLQLQYQRAEEAAFDIYTKEMGKLRNKFPLEESEILDKNQQASKDALERFRNDTKLDTDPKNFEQKQKLLTGKCALFEKGVCTGGFLRHLLDENENSSRTYCEEILSKLRKLLLEPLLKTITHDSSATMIATKIDAIFYEFDCNAIGPKKEEVRSNFLRELEDLKKQYQSTLEKMKDYNNKLESERMQKLKAEQEIRKKDEEKKSLEAQKTAMIKQHNSEITALQDQNQERIKQIERNRETALKKLESDLKSSHNAQVNSIKSAAESRAAQLQNQLQSVQNSQAALQASLAASQQQLQAAINRPPTVVHHHHKRGGGCFSSNDIVLVKQKNGQEAETLVSDLKVGDIVQSVDEKTGEIVWDTVYFIAHNEDIERKMPMLRVWYTNTSNEKKSISLTDTHLLYTDFDKDLPVQARTLETGDNIQILGPNGVEMTNITKIDDVTGTVRSPHTLNHHIIVNGVHASVHSKDERAYRMLTSIFRLAYWISPELTNTKFIQNIAENSRWLRRTLKF